MLRSRFALGSLNNGTKIPLFFDEDEKRTESNVTGNNSMKTKSDDDTVKDAVFLHYFHAFNILFMNGFMLHNRKHQKDEIWWSIGLLIAYASVKSQHRRFVFLVHLLFVINCFLRSTPNGANHKNMLAFASFILLPQQIQRCIWGDRNMRHVTTDTFNLLRCVIVMMYLMAGFHKINYDFLYEPTVSCAYEKVYTYFEIVGIRNFKHLSFPLTKIPYSVLAVELIPPILLCIRGRQIPAIVSLILLHLILMPMGFADFGSIAMSFLFLFVNPELIVQNGFQLKVYKDLGLLFCFFETITQVVWYLEDEDDDEPPFKEGERGLVLMAYGLFWTSTFRFWASYTSLKKNKKKIEEEVKNETDIVLPISIPRYRIIMPRYFGPRLHVPKSIASRLVLGFFLFFTLNPYLGLRTAGTLTMFSNLRTEGPTSNHLLLRNNPLKIFGYQEDVIEILDMDHPDRYKYGPGTIVPKVTFFKTLTSKIRERSKPFYMKVKYQGEILETNDFVNDPVFAKVRGPEPSFLELKWMNFRPIQGEGEPVECSW